MLLDAQLILFLSISAVKSYSYSDCIPCSQNVVPMHAFPLFMPLTPPPSLYHDYQVINGPPTYYSSFQQHPHPHPYPNPYSFYSGGNAYSENEFEHHSREPINNPKDPVSTEYIMDLNHYDIDLPDLPGPSLPPIDEFYMSVFDRYTRFWRRYRKGPEYTPNYESEKPLESEQDQEANANELLQKIDEKLKKIDKLFEENQSLNFDHV